MRAGLVVQLVTLVFAAIATSAASACTRAPVSGENAEIVANSINRALLSAAILAETNVMRCRGKRDLLSASPALANTATGHATWMAKAKKLSHRSTVSGRKTLTDRLRADDIDYRGAGENIALVSLYDLERKGGFRILSESECKFADRKGNTIPRHTYRSLAQKVVQMWSASAGHRKNLMNRGYSAHGAAIAVDTKAEHCGTIYVAQVFTG